MVTVHKGTAVGTGFCTLEAQEVRRLSSCRPCLVRSGHRDAHQRSLALQCLDDIGAGTTKGEGDDMGWIRCKQRHLVVVGVVVPGGVPECEVELLCQPLKGL